MEKHFIFIIFALTIISCNSPKSATKDYNFETVFEKSNGKETATYQEVVRFYTLLDEAFSTISTQEIGLTDSGKPLHLIIYNPEAEFDFKKIKEKKQVILINNGIHPGEPDGIDATMMLMRDYAQDSIALPQNTVIAAIAVYNVGGSLNRNSTSRVNQNGPMEYGFRGNGQNYDLNRDFIKADSRNALAFYEIFHLLQPDVFIGTHVSNGADYQYTLTHLFTQHNKLGGKLGEYLQEKFMVRLKDSLARHGWETTPYVSVFNQDPANGFPQFLDSPRYSSGYTTLWNCLGMMIETHMLKPYKDRVSSTYDFLEQTIALADKEAQVISRLREVSSAQYLQLDKYPLNFQPDSMKFSRIEFKGYEAETKISELTGLPHLTYNRKKPYTKEINYYNHFSPRDSVLIPEAYIIPQAWWKVVDLMKRNKIEMHALDKDTLLEVGVYKIETYKTFSMPYEGHYPHYDTKVSLSNKKIFFRKGDYIIPTHQPGIRYIIETLEPISQDSFFNWNFFDAILQQKEHFSPYVFEEVAAQFLKENPEIEEQFLRKKSLDDDFSKNWYAQLSWIYQKTPHYEKEHLRYPIYKLK
ncbi:MAG TPA: M14 family metallopeptidase [Flavobacteriaceae bacterium]|nr:M14 family metallopeptidase [Flavobacteriaceae bacterium]